MGNGVGDRLQSSGFDGDDIGEVLALVIHLENRVVVTCVQVTSIRTINT